MAPNGLRLGVCFLFDTKNNKETLVNDFVQLQRLYRIYLCLKEEMQNGRQIS